MLILQIILSILGILFSIWLYMLILCENPPTLKRIFHPCIEWWQDHHQNIVISILRLITRKLYQAVEWIFFPISKIFKFLIEVCVGIIAEALLYLIFFVIIGICIIIYKFAIHS